MKRFNSIKSRFILMLVSVFALCLAATLGYYFFVRNLIHDKEEVYVRNSISQVVNNIQTSAEDTVRLAKIASTSGATQDFLAASRPLERIVTSKKVFCSNFSITPERQESAILIMDDNGAILAPAPFLSITDTLESEYLDTLSAKSSGFTGLMRNTYDGISYFAYYQPILDVKYTVKPQRMIGSCIVLNPVYSLQACINRVETTPNSLFYILDSDLDVIVANKSSLDSSSDDLLHTLRAGNLQNGSVRQLNGSDHMIFFQEVPDTGWLVVGAIPLNEINSDLTGLLVTGVIVLVLLGLLFCLWGIVIFRSVALPVLEISRFIQGDAYSKFHKRLSLKNENEVGVLAGQINQMLDKISDMTHTILLNQSNMYELDLAKKRAELSALQSQINPHFLYNTLDCIKGYGYLLGSGEIVQIVDSLSQIMRYCIKGSDIVTIADELHIIEQYLSIISIRFDNRFTFSIEIPEAVRAYRIPRFILQPIIENAIYHGLEPKYGPGELRIYCEEDTPGSIRLCVRDNGAGIEPELLAQINGQLSCSTPQNLFEIESGKGLALLNINQRIRQLFGPDYGLTLESTPGEGTIVRLRIAVEQPEN